MWLCGTGQRVSDTRGTHQSQPFPCRNWGPQKGNETAEQKKPQDQSLTPHLLHCPQRTPYTHEALELHPPVPLWCPLESSISLGWAVEAHLLLLGGPEDLTIPLFSLSLSSLSSEQPGSDLGVAGELSP